jgi:pimeloyl-ACP methyl ester carboxylesterase
MSRDAKLVLLPGNNPDQQEWIEALRSALAPLFDEARVLIYRHWGSAGETDIDLEGEVVRLGELAADGAWVVVAKSAGVLLTMMAAARRVLVPEQAFFLGAPFLWTEQQGMPVGDLVGTFTVPTVFIQRRHDPACPVAELRALVNRSGMKDYEIEEIPGASHHYDDLALIKALVQKHRFGSDG